MADEGRMDDLTGRSSTAVRGSQAETGASDTEQEVEAQQTRGSHGGSKKLADSTESDAMGTGATGVHPVHSSSGE